MTPYSGGRVSRRGLGRCSVLSNLSAAEGLVWWVSGAVAVEEVFVVAYSRRRLKRAGQRMYFLRGVMCAVVLYNRFSMFVGCNGDVYVFSARVTTPNYPTDDRPGTRTPDSRCAYQSDNYLPFRTRLTGWRCPRRRRSRVGNLPP